MKKEIFVSPFLILMILSLISCNKDTDAVVQEPKPTPEEYCKNPSGLLTNEVANKMEELYKKNQYVAINEFFAKETPSYRDNRHFWYSVEELECYLSYIKHKGDSLGYDPSTMGLRIYLGAVPDKELQNRPKTKLFFVATGDKGNFIAAQSNIAGISPKNLGDTDGGDYNP